MFECSYRHNCLSTHNLGDFCSLFHVRVTRNCSSRKGRMYPLLEIFRRSTKPISFARHSWMIGNHYSTTKKVQDCLLNSLIMLVGVTLPSSMVKVAEVVLHRYGDSTNSSWVCGGVVHVRFSERLDGKPILCILHKNSVSIHKHVVFKIVVLQNKIIHHSQVATAKT